MENVRKTQNADKTPRRRTKKENYKWQTQRFFFFYDDFLLFRV